MTITDDDTGVGTTSTTVTVNNVAPIITAIGATIDENDVATVSGTITDPGSQDTFTIEIDWGEGTPHTYNYPAGSTSFSETHQYLDDNPTGTPADVYNINVTVTDDDTGSGSASTTVTINNVAPIITATGATINENDVATVSGTITDPGTQDTFTIEVDWGEGAPQTYNYPSGATSFSETHQYLDDNPIGTLSDVYNINVTITDDDTGVGLASTTVTVNNVSPTTSIDSMVQPYPSFIITLDVLEFTGSFTDPGTLDTHTIEWDFGDGTIFTGTLTPTHAYEYPGDYLVTLTITDDDGGIGTDTMEITVDAYSEATEKVMEDLENSFPPGDNKHVDKALDKLEKAEEKFDEYENKKGIEEIGKAIKELMKAQKEGADVGDEIDTLVALVEDLVDNTLLETVDLLGEDNKHIEKANKHMDKALEKLEDGKFDKAIKEFSKAYKEILKARGEWVPDGLEETADDAISEIDDLLSTGLPKKAVKSLEGAEKKLTKAVEKLEKGKMEEAINELKGAIKDLEKAMKDGVDTEDIIYGILEGTEDVVYQKISDAEYIAGPNDKEVVKAWEKFDEALLEIAEGDFDKAMDRFKDAVEKAEKAVEK